MHKKNSRKSIRHSKVFPKKSNMPKMSPTDSKIHAAQDLVNVLQNPAPDIPLATLGHKHKEELRPLLDIFGKSTSPAVPMRVPVRGAYQGNLQQTTNKKPKFKPKLIKSTINQYKTSKGAYCGEILR